jgi:hypothetical protein
MLRRLCFTSFAPSFGRRLRLPSRLSICRSRLGLSLSLEAQQLALQDTTFADVRPSSSLHKIADLTTAGPSRHSSTFRGFVSSRSMLRHSSRQHLLRSKQRLSVPVSASDIPLASCRTLMGRNLLPTTGLRQLSETHQALALWSGRPGCSQPCTWSFLQDMSIDAPCRSCHDS